MESGSGESLYRKNVCMLWLPDNKLEFVQENIAKPLDKNKRIMYNRNRTTVLLRRENKCRLQQQGNYQSPSS